MHGSLPVFFVYYLIGIHFCFSFLSICAWQISLSKTIYPIFGIAAIQKNYGYIGGSASGLTNGSIKKFGRNNTITIALPLNGYLQPHKNQEKASRSNYFEKPFPFHLKAGNGNRTRDLRTTNATLYRLSHASVLSTTQHMLSYYSSSFLSISKFIFYRSIFYGSECETEIPCSIHPLSFRFPFHPLNRIIDGFGGLSHFFRDLPVIQPL